jgi:signal recognition particle receptor subunit beta
VVLADTRRLADCFSSIDYFERRETPFVVAANHFAGSPYYDTESIRDALDLEADVPIMICDARSRDSVKEVLIASVTHALQRHQMASRH